MAKGKEKKGKKEEKIWSFENAFNQQGIHTCVCDTLM